MQLLKFVRRIHTWLMDRFGILWPVRLFTYPLSEISKMWFPTFPTPAQFFWIMVEDLDEMTKCRLRDIIRNRYRRADKWSLARQAVLLTGTVLFIGNWISPWVGLISTVLALVVLSVAVPYTAVQILRHGRSILRRRDPDGDTSLCRRILVISVVFVVLVSLSGWVVLHRPTIEVDRVDENWASIEVATTTIHVSAWIFPEAIIGESESARRERIRRLQDKLIMTPEDLPRAERIRRLQSRLIEKPGEGSSR